MYSIATIILLNVITSLKKKFNKYRAKKYSYQGSMIGRCSEKNKETIKINSFILLHEKFLQFDWFRAVVFQLNLKYLHVKITDLLRVVV